MIKVFFKKSGFITSTMINEGQTILDAAKQINIKEIPGDCKGNCACGTCHIHIHEDWVDKIKPIWSASLETFLLEKSSYYNKKLSRVSCQIDVKKDYDGLIINLIGESSIK